MAYVGVRAVSLETEVPALNFRYVFDRRERNSQELFYY
jgi:hypothetical protein